MAELPRHFSIDEDGFSPLVAMCFTVNYIMGTGFLTLPWAFYSAGIVLSLFTIAIVCLVSDISKSYVLETMARADALFRAESIKVNEVDGRMSLISEGEEGGVGSGYGAVNDESSGLLRKRSHSKDDVNNSGHHVVRRRKFEVIEMCHIFLTGNMPNWYMLTIGLYMYGTLWAYTSVFAKAMSEALPLAKILDLGDDDYLLYAVIFAAVVVPLTCMELKEQVAVQVFLSLCRFLMVVIVVGSVLGAMNSTTPQFGSQTHAEPDELYPFYNIDGLYKMLPIAVYANIFHHSIPGLSSPVADKRKLSFIYSCTFAFGMVAYSLIGGLVAYYFGAGIQESANLNWVSYHAGTGELVCYENGNCRFANKAWWVQIVAYYVVCFPATDVVSAFPLNGITLGNSLMGSWYGNRIREVEGDRTTRTLFRLLGAIPPIIGACFVRELGTITAYTGVTGFIIAFTFPAILNVKSRQALRKVGLRHETWYTRPVISDDWFCMCVAWFGGALVVYVLFNLITHG